MPTLAKNAAAIDSTKTPTCKPRGECSSAILVEHQGPDSIDERPPRGRSPRGQATRLTDRFDREKERQSGAALPGRPFSSSVRRHPAKERPVLALWPKDAVMLGRCGDVPDDPRAVHIRLSMCGARHPALHGQTHSRERDQGEGK
jgi:hypothetical protein